MKKRFLSLLMAFCLMLSLAPAAFAADNTMTQDSFKAAIANAETNGTVELTGDVTLTETITINKPITIDGKGFMINGASGISTLRFEGVPATLKNLTIVSGRYAIIATGSALTVDHCDIQAARGGISFEAPADNATLDVTNTTIKNTNVSNYNTTADYGEDNRGISIYNVKGGTVNISNCSILGFKYSINPVVDPVSNLRDGEGSEFNITNCTIKGWTALNMWSANTVFNFKACTLVGINALPSGSDNNFSTIVANDNIYGTSAGGTKSSVVNIIGGVVQAVQLKNCAQAAFNVDNQLQTKFNFYQNGRTPVNIQVYFPENVQNDVGIWNFHWLYANNSEKINQYLSEMVTGLTNATGTFLPSSDWEAQYGGTQAAAAGIALAAEYDDVLTRFTGNEGHTGGDIG